MASGGGGAVSDTGGSSPGSSNGADWERTAHTPSTTGQEDEKSNTVINEAYQFHALGACLFDNGHKILVQLSSYRLVLRRELL